MFQPAALAASAMRRPPISPCSSPDNPTKTMVALKRWWLRTRAASIVPAMPLALSFAPGESSVLLKMSEIRESISPDMMR